MCCIQALTIKQILVIKPVTLVCHFWRNKQKCFDCKNLFCLYSTPSHYHHIWRHWTYKMTVRYILSSVWLRLSIVSPLSIIQYVGLYVLSLPISLVMIEIIYILCLIIITKSEVWTITHCLGLGHETMVSAVCLSIFFCSSPILSSNI